MYIQMPPPYQKRSESHIEDPSHPVWHHQGSPFHFQAPPPSRGSLLQELYDHDLPPEHSLPGTPHSDIYVNEHAYGPGPLHGDYMHQPSPHHHPRHPHDVGMIRRATFPYVRQDHPSPALFGPEGPMDPYQTRQDALYGEPLPMSAEPGTLHRYQPMHPSPHTPYHDLHDDPIKLEESHVIVPSQQFYPARHPHMPQHAHTYPYPPQLPIQHTDDAASKETQYLRRRCNNCHTTEPPSWRRSTLNPGKIVCNKCGLYERTHLRPRPLRFDELRAGGKGRKASGAAGVQRKASPKVKKETSGGSPAPGGTISRRASVSSIASSTHSGSGMSDWDDNVSVYSGGSNPPSTYPSPQTFSIPMRDPSSASPPASAAGIRLPPAPMSDLHPHSPHMPLHGSPLQHAAALASPQQAALELRGPAKSQTTPPYEYERAGDAFLRRGSLPVHLSGYGRETGWVPVAPAPGEEGGSRSGASVAGDVRASPEVMAV
ncbi:hypothetical protein OE88DRAFT_1709887 [Heliocybe sulcata]|uniref:GATA-type domain-containing protein n=1 Tax=Heliocybe sulcata TaxID=5364 RepID=A0A5C3NDE0_9AGAM|nr:hypothetical protein OE88DRAFT_1709887 [Heliocybe sulcata]